MLFLSMYTFILLTKKRYVHSITAAQSELDEAMVTDTRTPYHHVTFLNVYIHTHTVDKHIHRENCNLMFSPC